MNYYAYINGPQWKANRAKHLGRHKKVCEACTRTDDIQVHHRTYERMGDELDGDLAVLCTACHILVHQLHDSLPFASLDEATTLLIDNVHRGYFGDKDHHLPGRKFRRR